MQHPDPKILQLKEIIRIFAAVYMMRNPVYFPENVSKQYFASLLSTSHRARWFISRKLN